MTHNFDLNNNTSNNKRIARNTILLYIRMLVMMIISLYTSRVVLQALGVEDYGIYNVVGGVVSMFTILSGSLSTAISRYITFELGRDDLNRQKTVFSTSVNIQLILIGILFVVFETVGVWFLNNRMSIPDGRLVAANWVLQFSIITFAINLLAVPYNAAIISHEKISAFAYISIFEAIFKLAIAFVIMKSPFDRLVFYGLLLLIVSIIIRYLYVWYCGKNFEECKYRAVLDKTLIKEMFAFAGWNFFGTGSGQLMSQGVNILANVFFGVTINAARGIANQVNGAVLSFVHSFTTAVNPQITKSYASGNKDYMKELIYRSAKFSYFLLLFFAIPIIFETDIILKLWLVEVPAHSANFVKLIVCISMVFVLSNSMITAMLATGDIKKYQLIVGGLGMLVFPLAWLAFAIGLPPESSYIIMLLIYIIQAFVRIVLLREMVNISIAVFTREVLFVTIKVTLLAIVVPLIIVYFWDESIIRFVVLCFISTIITFLSIYFAGLSKGEKNMIINMIKKRVY